MFEINVKSDILIPFERVGDQSWEIATKLILTSLAHNWNKTLPLPKSKQDVVALENRLGTTLPDGLKLFYQTFGIANIGEELLDFDEISYLKDIWASAPQYGPDLTEADSQHLPYLVRFSDYLGNGNYFCFHSETKEIYYFDHDDGVYISKFFDLADDYLRGCLIYAQQDLFGPNLEQSEVIGWAEETVISLFGKDIVRKWQY